MAALLQLSFYIDNYIEGQEYIICYRIDDEEEYHCKTVSCIEIGNCNINIGLDKTVCESVKINGYIQSTCTEELKIYWNVEHNLNDLKCKKADLQFVCAPVAYVIFTNTGNGYNPDTEYTLTFTNIENCEGTHPVIKVRSNSYGQLNSYKIISQDDTTCCSNLNPIFPEPEDPNGTKAEGYIVMKNPKRFVTTCESYNIDLGPIYNDKILKCCIQRIGQNVFGKVDIILSDIYCECMECKKYRIINKSKEESLHILYINCESKIIYYVIPPLSTYEFCALENMFNIGGILYKTIENTQTGFKNTYIEIIDYEGQTIGDC